MLKAVTVDKFDLDLDFAKKKKKKIPFF